MRIIEEIWLEGSQPDGSPVKIVASVKELTTGEIRAWLKASGSDQGDVVDFTLFEDFSTLDVLTVTTLTPDQVAVLPPSELRRAWEKAGEINADFFAMRNRVAQLGRQVLANSLSEQPQSLQPMVTPTSGNTRGASFWQRVKATLKLGSGK